MNKSFFMTRHSSRGLLLLVMAITLTGCGGTGGQRRGDTGAGTFASPQAAVPEIRRMLKGEEWAELARYYDLSDSPYQYSDLESGTFFVHINTDALPQPREVTRFRHPFAPSYEYQGQIATGNADIVIVEMAVTIDQGEGLPPQRGLSWFKMKRMDGGWKILPDAVLPLETSGERIK